jgi:hypothetical protein
VVDISLIEIHTLRITQPAALANRYFKYETVLAMHGSTMGYCHTHSLAYGIMMTDACFMNENISSKHINEHSCYCTLEFSYETTRPHTRTFL